MWCVCVCVAAVMSLMGLGTANLKPLQVGTVADSISFKFVFFLTRSDEGEEPSRSAAYLSNS